MAKWPFWGGLITQLLAFGRFVDKSLNVSGRMVGNLLLIATFLVILTHVAHLLGVPVPDLLPFLPSLASSPGN